MKKQKKITRPNPKISTFPIRPIVPRKSTPQKSIKPKSPPFPKRKPTPKSAPSPPKAKSPPIPRKLPEQKSRERVANTKPTSNTKKNEVLVEQENDEVSVIEILDEMVEPPSDSDIEAADDIKLLYFSDLEEECNYIRK